MRDKDWTQTPLGAVESWPRSLVNYVQMIFEMPTGAIIFWGDIQTQIYNQGYAEIMGPRHPKYFGGPLSECWPDTYPFVYPMMRKVLDHGEVIRVEKTHLMVTRFGFPEEAFFTFTFSPLRDDDGIIRGVLQPVFEVTDTVLSERRAKILRELAPRAASLDPVKDVIEVITANANDIPFCALYLWDDLASELVLATRTDNLTNLDLTALTAIAQQTFTESTAITINDASERIGADALGPWPEPARAALVVPLQRASSDVRIGAAVFGLSPRLHFDDKYQSFLELAAGQVATALDTKRVLEEAQSRAAALAELDRAKTTFFSNVSHELRTPLMLIIGPVEEALNANQSLGSEDLGRVYRNSLRLLKLVNTLLDFSRIDADRLQTSFEPLDLAAYTRDLASLFASSIEAAGLQFSILTPALPQAVYVDPDLWEKIVLNLLSNAYKFTLQGEVELRLEARADHVELSVRDTGSGIPSEEMQYLFDRFHRVRGIQSRTHEGTGIGLALTRELVLKHGGTVSAESVVGQGSIFRVTIPLGHSHLPHEAVQASSLSTRNAASAPSDRARSYAAEASGWLRHQQFDSATTGQGDGAQVLVVDDNADVRDYLIRLLSKSDYRVSTAANGREALDLMQLELPDLVVSDVMMPELDGLELVRALRAHERTQTLPIILSSARAGDDKTAEGMNAGANDYIVKPFTSGEFLARVAAQIEIARVRDEKTQELRESLIREQQARTAAEALAAEVVTQSEQAAKAVLQARTELERALARIRELEQGHN